MNGISCTLRRRLLMAAIAVALLTQFSVFKAQAENRLKILDAGLSAGGVFSGNVLTRQGNASAGSEVALLDLTGNRAVTRTDQQGNFTFSSLRGGVYQVVTRDDLQFVRLWAPNTAPPAAKRQIQLYDGGVIRAQCGCRMSLLSRLSVRNNCCNCGAVGGGNGGGVAMGEGDVPVPPPVASEEEIRALVPDLPEEQFAALTRADVVITNPDHYSVAIVYDAATNSATVVAKAVDNVALQVQAAARAGGVPVVQRPPLAQALYELPVGGQVPANLVAQIAEIVAGLAPAAVAAPIAGATGVGGTPGINAPQVLVGAGILGAAVIVPFAATVEDETYYQSGS